MTTAMGTAHAIVHVFSKKKGLKDFQKALKPKATGASDSDNMRELRRRLQPVVDLGRR